jgi:hypothetical protein
MEGPVIICNGCNEPIHPAKALFHCSCRATLFDLCPGCALLKPELVDDHDDLHPCLVDLRDHRRTFIPGPSAQEFRRLLDKPARGLRTQFHRFFSHCDLDGVTEQRTKEILGPDTTGGPQTPITTKKIENDYSIYDSLSRERKEIRLVQIEPGEPEDPIVLNIRTVPHPWNQLQRWLALSYTWGSLEETRKVSLRFHSHIDESDTTSNGSRGERATVSFNCTASLEMAIREIRKMKTRGLTWIDALCINQGDPDERAHQVSFMADIYAAAPYVGVWLGTEFEAAGHIRLLTNFLKMVREKEDKKDCMKDEYHVMEHLVKDLDPLGDYDLRSSRLEPAIRRFFSNPWFTRAWVVQEVWAGRFVAVMCGRDRNITWDEVIQANSYLKACASTHRSAPNATATVPSGGTQVSGSFGQPLWAQFVKEKDPGIASTSSRIPALDLLTFITLHLHASDKRDLIFAILSLCRETEDLPRLPPLVAPDYSKPPWQVFSDFTRWYLVQEGSLNLLGLVTYTVRGEDADLGGTIPSWSLSPRLKLQFTLGRSMATDRVKFQADANAGLDVGLLQTSPCDRLLLTSGYEMDHVEWVDNGYFIPMLQGGDPEAPVSIPYPWRVGSDSSIYPNTCGLEWLWRKVRKVSALGRCTLDPDAAEAATCACRRAFDAMLDATTGELVDFKDREDRNTLYRWYASLWVASTSDPEMLQFCQPIRDVLLPLIDETQKSAFVENRAMAVAYRRSLFLTRKGYLGLSSPAARKGDSVVVLAGCRTPMVMVSYEAGHASTGQQGPSEPQEWRLVGECHVNGLMDGEAFKQKITSDMPMQNFTLA